MPTEELCPQLTNALTEIGSGDFRIMTDDVRPDIVRPVFYEPVFFDEDGELASQKIIYLASAATKPKSAQQSIDRVAAAIELTDTASNPVRYAIEQQAGHLDDKPDFLEEILPVIDAQSTTNTARVIGGLLMIKDARTSVVGLRCVYNRALMEASTTWQLRDLALSGELGDDPTEGIKSRNPDDLGDIAARMTLHCLAASRKLKPALILAPTLGLRNM